MDVWAQGGGQEQESGGLHAATVKHLWEILSDKGTTKKGPGSCNGLYQPLQTANNCSGGGLKWPQPLRRALSYYLLSGKQNFREMFSLSSFRIS